MTWVRLRVKWGGLKTVDEAAGGNKVASGRDRPAENNGGRRRGL